ncbi:hypothetical protein KKH05_01310 [Patescibacteria group bacterium]|nr:hypothetical protein [Patescibacteria group bacterium]
MLNDDDDKNTYFDELKRRADESKVYSEHQMMGLMLAEILEDEEHKSLYMKLAKEYDADRLLKLAKDIADRPNIENRGAYFMKMLYDGKNLDNR